MFTNTHSGFGRVLKYACPHVRVDYSMAVYRRSTSSSFYSVDVLTGTSDVYITTTSVAVTLLQLTIPMTATR